MMVWTARAKNNWARIYWARVKKFFARRLKDAKQRELLNRVAELEKKVAAHNDAILSQGSVTINNIFDTEAGIIFLSKNKNLIMNMITDEAQKDLKFRAVFQR